MKAVNLLIIGREFLKLMSDFGLKRDDWKHIQLFEEYGKMRDEGEKVDYILCYLAQKYHTSESTIKRIVRRLSREQWQSAMEQHGHALEGAPNYNRCALWVTMNMVMSDSKDTLEKYIDKGNIFEMVYDLALDKLCDDDKKFSIRKYFDV